LRSVCFAGQKKSALRREIHPSLPLWGGFGAVLYVTWMRFFAVKPNTGDGDPLLCSMGRAGIGLEKISYFYEFLQGY